MANTLLTPTAVTNEALRILHNKAQFIGTINRQYDDRFAKSGAKIGDTLTIRKPNKYTVRTGATLNVQNTTEESTTLQVATQKGVDMNFSSAELTMSLQDFSERILAPAMNVLVANIESDAYSMYKDVWNVVDGDAAALTLYHILDGKRYLDDNLTPMDGNRTAMLSTLHSAKMIDAVKALFNDSTTISKQYKEGMVGRTAGFDFYANPIVPKHQTGTAVATSLYTVNGATESGSAITIQTGTTTFLVGDVVTFAGANAVHPETKADLGYLQKFVVTANLSAAGDLSISPALTVSGAGQNVTDYPDNAGAVVKVGCSSVASATMDSSMVYHKDAFTFATADLVMPSGVDFAARKVLDGISLRIVRQYDINNDQFPCRIDILYGKKAIRPEMACRIHADA